MTIIGAGNLFRVKRYQVADHRGRLLHVLFGYPFELAVEVEAAGEDVRAREAAGQVPRQRARVSFSAPKGL